MDKYSALTRHRLYLIGSIMRLLTGIVLIYSLILSIPSGAFGIIIFLFMFGGLNLLVVALFFIGHYLASNNKYYKKI